VGRPLWREDGSVICSAICQWSESRRTQNSTLLSHLRLLGSLSVASYDSQGLRWKYSYPPPHGNAVLWQLVLVMCPLYGPHKKRLLEQLFCDLVCMCHGYRVKATETLSVNGRVAEPFPRIWRLCCLHNADFRQACQNIKTWELEEQIGTFLSQDCLLNVWCCFSVGRRQMWGFRGGDRPVALIFRVEQRVALNSKNF
jgi:hypothetical protein